MPMLRIALAIASAKLAIFNSVSATGESFLRNLEGQPEVEISSFLSPDRRLLVEINTACAPFQACHQGAKVQVLTGDMEGYHVSCRLPAQGSQPFTYGIWDEAGRFLSLSGDGVPAQVLDVRKACGTETHLTGPDKETDLVIRENCLDGACLRTVEVVRPFAKRHMRRHKCSPDGGFDVFASHERAIGLDDTLKISWSDDQTRIHYEDLVKGSGGMVDLAEACDLPPVEETREEPKALLCGIGSGELLCRRLTL